MSNPNVSLNCANRFQENAKVNADLDESKVEISETVTSELFEESKEIKHQLNAATTKAASFRSKLLEIIKTNTIWSKN